MRVTWIVFYETSIIFLTNIVKVFRHWKYQAMGESTREKQGFIQGWGKLTQTGNKWLEKLQLKELRWMNATDTVPLKSLEMPPCYM